MPSMPTVFHERTRYLAALTALVIFCFLWFGESSPQDVEWKTDHLRTENSTLISRQISTAPPRKTVTPTPLPLRETKLTTLVPTVVPTTVQPSRAAEENEGEEKQMSDEKNVSPSTKNESRVDSVDHNTTNTTMTEERPQQPISKANSTQPSTPTPTTTATAHDEEKETNPSVISSSDATSLSRSKPILSATFPKPTDTPPNSTLWMERNCRLTGLDWFPKEELAWQQRAPYVVLIGAAQSGVPSLSKALLQHPQFVDQNIHNELHFFNNFPSLPSDGISVRYARAHLYAKHFSTSLEQNGTDPLYSLDATPQYFLESKTVPQRLFCVCPWAKLILLVRNPVERLLAQFEWAIQQQGWRKKSLQDWISDDWGTLQSVGLDPTNAAVTNDMEQSWNKYHDIRPSLDGPIANGLYGLPLYDWVNTLQQIQQHTPQLLVLRYKDWKEQPVQVLKKITDFLGVPAFPDDTLQSFADKHTSPTSRSDKADVQTRQLIEEFYKPYQQWLCRTLEWEEGDECWQVERKEESRLLSSSSLLS